MRAPQSMPSEALRSMRAGAAERTSSSVLPSISAAISLRLLRPNFSQARINAPKSRRLQFEKPSDNSCSFSATSSSVRGNGSSGLGTSCAWTTSSLAPWARAAASFWDICRVQAPAESALLLSPLLGMETLSQHSCKTSGKSLQEVEKVAGKLRNLDKRSMACAEDVGLGMRG